MVNFEQVNAGWVNGITDVQGNFLHCIQHSIIFKFFKIQDIYFTLTAHFLQA